MEPPRSRPSQAFKFKTIFLLLLIAAVAAPIQTGTASGASFNGLAGKGALIDSAKAATTLSLQALKDTLKSMLREKGGKLSVSRETGEVTFIGSRHRRAIEDSAATAESTASGSAYAYARRYGPLFGLSTDTRELEIRHYSKLPDGRSSVRLRQVYKGIPVFGAELVVNLDEDRRLLSMSGEISPSPSLSTKPEITAHEAQNTAVAATAKYKKIDVNKLKSTPPRLSVYDSRLLVPAYLRKSRPGAQALVWETEVSAENLDASAREPVREVVLVDATTGSIALHFSRVAHARNRLTYDSNNSSALPGSGAILKCTESQSGCTNGALPDADKAHRYAGDTYSFYSSIHNRDSYDNAGASLISSVRFAPEGSTYRNAYWDGQRMVYGAGFSGADDVVGHELTHAVTEYSSGLFYVYESGAINESFSDVWGEFIDQSNGAGNDGSGVKWLIGEDLPIGAIRSMSNPPSYGDPDKMTSPNYHTSSEDYGGVHFNSGVNNKAAFLMTDGGSFNGKTVTGLGIIKVAIIYYEAQTNLLTPVSGYEDLYNALNQACQNLIGTSGITPGDCQEVRDSLDAVEMNQPPASGFSYRADICSAGYVPNDLFYADLSTLAGLESQTITGAANPFVLNDWFGLMGDDSRLGADLSVTSDAVLTMTGDVLLPAGALARYAHAYSFEADSGGSYDGGVFEYSTNGGESWQDAEQLRNGGKGYDATLSTSSGNPIGGRRAFAGDSPGRVSSRYDLSSLAGKSVRFRFRVASDTSIAGILGWLINDFRIYTCGASPWAPTGSVVINSGASHTTSPTVSLSLAATAGSSGDVSQMRFSNNGSSWSSWENYGGAKSWTLTGADGNKTVYAQFKDIAGNVSATTSDAIFLDRARLTLLSKYGTVTYGGQTRFSGTLKDGIGLPLAGRTVVIQRRGADGSWTTIGSAVTDASGAYSRWNYVTRNATYRAYSPAFGGFLAKYSSWVAVYVRTKSGISLGASSLKLGNSLKVSGWVAPAHPYKYVYLQRYSPAAGTWRTVKIVKLSSKSTFTTYYKPGWRATWSFRLYVPKDSDHVAGTSPGKILKVY